jgi:HAD superfamily hydrolase (TIGR01484 family)
MTKNLCAELKLNISEVIEKGKSKPADTLFSMTTLALNSASLTNAVSKIHGEKARELWPNYPIIHITNGIYIPRWDRTGHSNIVKSHKINEVELLKLIRKVHGDKWKKEGLLIGWSRRFVPYKRPLALLDDVAKLKQLAEHFKGKIHIVYSAPLGEEDADKNEFLKKIYELMNGELKGLITFIPNYRIEVAETLVAGCDVWLNTPIVGREACGTSGMKAALNGTLNLSTNDGWIAEVPLNDFGWIVDDNNLTDSLLNILENKVLPEYEKFDNWPKFMQKSRELILSQFSTKRMLAEYIKKLYKPVLNLQPPPTPPYPRRGEEKKVVAFDVDGTLSDPRRPIDDETAELLASLLKNKHVAVISGGAFEHIKEQVLEPLSKQTGFQSNFFKNMTLLPTNGSGFWTYDDKWNEITSRKLTVEEKEKITKALEQVDQEDPELRNNKSFGREIQDRESSITYAALGENAPVQLKHDWDPDFKKRIVLQAKLMKILPEFEVKIGGTTSIDITPKGMDKAYGISNLIEYLKITKENVLFFGDAVYENGNDYPVKQMGVETIKVSGPEQTKAEIRKILNI